MQSTKQKQRFKKILKSKGFSQRRIVYRFIEYAMNNIADWVIIPMYDILNEGKMGRINTPGTIGSPNWEWKIVNYKKLKRNIKDFKKIIIQSNREIIKKVL